MLFEIDPKPLGEELTALGGVPLVVQAFRSLGLPAAVQEHMHIKQRERGYDEATYVESLVVLNAVGRGVCGGSGAMAGRRGAEQVAGT